MQKSLPMNTFAINVRQSLEEQGLTVQELADRCGVLRPNLSRMLHHPKNVTLETMCKIADALDVHVSELLMESVAVKK
jgi:transcriptional regulator with XRE-family HTH domain